MRNFLALIISLTVLVSCGNEKVNNNNSDYSSAKPDGEEIISSYSNGVPKLIYSYVIEEGEHIVIYEKENYQNGRISKEGGMKNGKRHGLWKSFRNDGLLWSEGNFENGIRNGIAKTYHPNGKKYYDGFYSNGKKSEIWKFYNENGDIIKEVDYNKK
jgi:antitoxin component YwqK of YwqJK toxin-antitoxin module